MHHPLLPDLPDSLRQPFAEQLGEHLVDNKLQAERCASALVLPCLHNPATALTVYDYRGGVERQDGTFVEGTQLHEKPCEAGGAFTEEMKRTREAVGVSTEHTTVIYLGFILPVWGHALTDGLKKLWYLHTPEGQALLAEGARPAYVTFQNVPLPAHARELFRLAGCEPEQWLHVTQATRFDRVVVPDNSFLTAPNERRTFTHEFVDTISRIRQKALAEYEAAGGHSTAWGERVYLTRRHLARRNDWGERSVERVFEQLGYRIVAPERLSVVAQIALWATTPTIATTEGSIAHGALFMKPGSEVVILMKADYVNGYQHAVNAFAHLHATFLPAHHSTLSPTLTPWHGPFFLYRSPALCRWSGLGLTPQHPTHQFAYWQYRLEGPRLLWKLRLWLYILWQKVKKRA